MAENLPVLVCMHIGEKTNARLPWWTREGIAAHIRLVGRNDYV